MVVKTTTEVSTSLSYNKVSTLQLCAVVRGVAYFVVLEYWTSDVPLKSVTFLQLCEL